MSDHDSATHQGSDTEPMKSLRPAGNVDQLREELNQALKDLDQRVQKHDIAIIGTDVKPGVYALVYAMKAEVALLREDIKDERTARLASEREQSRDEKIRDIAMWCMAAGMGVTAVASVVILLIKVFAN